MVLVESGLLSLLHESLSSSPQLNELARCIVSYSMMPDNESHLYKI